MANLYDLLMAKERGSIKDAPNKQRIGQAPLNLRSAMKYAVGGLTDSDINAYVQANIGNPAAIAEAAQKYQVTAEDLARATGYSPEEVNTYFSSAGVGGPYRGRPTPLPREEPVPPPRETTRPEPIRPRYEEPTPPPRPIAPSYPEDLRPQSPQVPQTSYRQEPDGTFTQVGYDDQPVSGYTESQMAMNNATNGTTPSEYAYVWNGQGYNKVRMGGITMDDGTFIPGAANAQGGMNVGTPDFFQKYANDPQTMAQLRQMYGFTGDAPINSTPLTPTEAAYPPGYFDPKQAPEPTNIGYPIQPTPRDMGGPAQVPPSSGLLGSLGYGGLGSGQSSTGQVASGLGAGLPGQSMQGQAGTGQSLDSLINYLADYRKKI